MKELTSSDEGNSHHAQNSLHIHDEDSERWLNQNTTAGKKIHLTKEMHECKSPSPCCCRGADFLPSKHAGWVNRGGGGEDRRKRWGEELRGLTFFFIFLSFVLIFLNVLCAPQYMNVWIKEQHVRKQPCSACSYSVRTCFIKAGPSVPGLHLHNQNCLEVCWKVKFPHWTFYPCSVFGHSLGLAGEAINNQ